MVCRSGSDDDVGCDGLTEKRKEKDLKKKKKRRRIRRRRRQRGKDRDKDCVKKKGVYLEEKRGLGGK